MLKTIVVAVDGSGQATRAVEYGAALAKLSDADLVLLHVMSSVGLGRIPPELREIAQVEHIEISESAMLKRIGDQILDSAERRAHQLGVDRVRKQLSVGQPAETIVSEATAVNADLIVMGRRGLGLMAELLMGSVSHKVSHLARCACTTVP